MKIKYNNEIYNISGKSNNSELIVKLGDNQFAFHLSNLSNIRNIDSNKKVFKAEDKKHIYVNIDGEYYKFDKIDDEFGAAAQVNDSNHEFIYSPTPGNIIKVLVENDDLVKEGIPLIIIESMKMENTIYSSISGKVSNIQAKAGEQVSNDKLIMEIRKEE